MPAKTIVFVCADGKTFTEEASGAVFSRFLLRTDRGATKSFERTGHAVSVGGEEGDHLETAAVFTQTPIGRYLYERNNLVSAVERASRELAGMPQLSEDP